MVPVARLSPSNTIKSPTIHRDRFGRDPEKCPLEMQRCLTRFCSKDHTFRNLVLTVRSQCRLQQLGPNKGNFRYLLLMSGTGEVFHSPAVKVESDGGDDAHYFPFVKEPANALSHSLSNGRYGGQRCSGPRAENPKRGQTIPTNARQNEASSCS